MVSGTQTSRSALAYVLELPSISGVKTWRRLRERNPDLSAVISGGTLTDAARSEL